VIIPIPIPIPIFYIVIFATHLQIFDKARHMVQ
jgi:hypothetical protein